MLGFFGGGGVRVCLCVWACEHVHNESHVAPRHDAPKFRITEVRDAHLVLTTMRARARRRRVCVRRGTMRQTFVSPQCATHILHSPQCTLERPEVRVGAADSKIWCEAATPLIRKDWRIQRRWPSRTRAEGCAESNRGSRSRTPLQLMNLLRKWVGGHRAAESSPLKRTSRGALRSRRSRRHPQNAAKNGS